MSKTGELFKELVQDAQQLNNEHWVETGNNIPQENAIVTLLYKEIKTLKEQVEKLQKEKQNGQE